MFGHGLRTSSLLLTLSLIIAGCSDDGSVGTNEGDDSESGESGESGETSDSDATTTPGDGDGDMSGDGDGDPAGDGDGDDPGDGDGDEPGDGDGDTSGDGDGDDPPEEGLACGTIVACVQDCGNDLDCADACVAEGSPTGAGEYDALLQCVIDNNCNNDNCIEQNCGAELSACYTGDNTCADLLGCTGMCGGDPVCQTDCFYGGSGLAQAQIQELGECVEANACGGDQACIEENCGAELTGCVGGGADTLPCPIVSECLIDCDGDPDCELNCVPVSPEAQAEADALVECAEQNDCQDLDCTEQACPDVFVECISGEGSCPELLECVVACNGNELCEYNCVVDTGLMEQFVAGQLNDCAEDNDCALDDIDCLMSNCGAESVACGLV